MNTKEAAVKWGCSETTVREYCRSGMIPLAEKKIFGWEIPDEMEKKPPVTRTKAVYLMRCISDDALPVTRGYWSEEKLIAALEYLSDVKFILDYEGNVSLEEAVKRSRISTIGKELIAKESKKNIEKSIGAEISAEGGIDKGLPTAKGKIVLKGSRTESGKTD